MFWSGVSAFTPPPWLIDVSNVFVVLVRIS
jgi:hypothetical protein